MNKKNLFTQKKKDAYNLMIINENSLKSNDEMIIEKIMSLTITFQQHHEKFILNIVRMINHDVVLRMLWLKMHNLNIDWKIKIFTFKRCDCVIDIQFTHWQRSMINE